MQDHTQHTAQRQNNAVANNLTTGNGNSSEVLSLPAVKPILINDEKISNQLPVQLLSITTHGTGDAMRAGGGQGSKVKTGREVQNIINQGTRGEIQTAISILSTSIQNRAAYEATLRTPDQSHAARTQCERGWLSELNDALQRIQNNHATNMHQTMFGAPAAVSVTHHTGPGNGRADNDAFKHTL